MFEEHKYEELKKLGTELHIPIVEAFLRLEVFDKDGNLVQEHSQRSHTWTRNAYNTLFSQMAGKNCDDSTFAAGKLSAKTTSGTVSYGEYSFGMDDGDIDGTVNGYRAPASEDAWGILVGSGTNAESFEDYVLQTPIADGTSSSQLSYVASQAHSITYTAGTKVLKNDLVRYLNNNSGGSVSVNEVALVPRLKSPSSSSSNTNYLVSRDKLGATITVADTGQLKVTYTIQITYPA